MSNLVEARKSSANDGTQSEHKTHCNYLEGVIRTLPVVIATSVFAKGHFSARLYLRLELSMGFLNGPCLRQPIFLAKNAETLV